MYLRLMPPLVKLLMPVMEIIFSKSMLALLTCWVVPTMINLFSMRQVQPSQLMAQAGLIV